MNLRTIAVTNLLAFVGVSQASSQVVQLPTFHQFSVSTTVSVPDSGSMVLGSVRRSRRSFASHGVPGLGGAPFVGPLFRGRAMGVSSDISTASVSATIIDHAELDRAVLDEAASRRGESPAVSEIDRRAAYLSRFIARRPELTVGKGISDSPAPAAHWKTLARQAEREREDQMQEYLARAERAVAAGRFGSARCSYAAVVRLGNPSQQKLARIKLAAMDSVPGDAKPASTNKH